MPAKKDLKNTLKSFCSFAILIVFNFTFSQNKTPFSLSFVNGISLPTKDLKNFSKSGFKSGFVINKAFCDNISLGLATSYATLPLKNDLNTYNKNWNSFSINVGPQYHLNINKAFLQFYGHLGLSFINTPEVTVFYPQTTLISTSLKQSNTSALNTRFGINLGTEICNGLYFFVSTEYNTTTKNKINYLTRDLSSAEDRTGGIDSDLANEIPFKNNAFSFSTINFNFGIRLDLNSGFQKAQDHNASRSNTTSSKTADKPDDGGDNTNENSSRAQDHNASRSNTTSSKTADKPNDGGDNTNENSSRAQDHNASRSNTTSSKTADKPNDSGGNTNENSSRAQDHNASRSNTTSSKTAEKPNDGGDNTNENSSRAQDHNASRSNTTSSKSSNKPNNKKKSKDRNSKKKN